MHQVSLKLTIAATAFAGVGNCQVQLPGFEVASVKTTASADGRSLLQAVPGRLMMRNIALRRLILIAYDIQDDQLLGDPPWVGSEHYDIQAKADGNPSVQQMEGPMLQALLGERFKLLTPSRDSASLPSTTLSVGKSGTKLQASHEGRCTPYVADAPPPTTKPGEPLAIFCGFQHTDQGLIRSLDGKGVTMTELARTLSRSYVASLGRNVIDGSGLTGDSIYT